MKTHFGTSLFAIGCWVMASLVDRPDAEFICARWEQLVPNGNFQTASTRGEHGVTGLWTELWGESGQRVWSVRRN